MLQYQFRLSETGKSQNTRKKTSTFLWYEQCLKIPGTTTLWKRFPKLYYNSSVIAMIAKSEKMKMKKSHLPPTILYFVSSNFLKNQAPPT